MDAAPECESSSNTLMSKSVVTSQMTDTAPQVSHTLYPQILLIAFIGFVRDAVVL